MIHVDFGELLSGQPPLLTAGQQVIAMADFSNPARDQGVISVQVQAGPPALVNLNQQVAEPHGGQNFPVQVGVSDAFGNSLSGIQVRLKVFENQVLTQTLFGTTASPVTFNIQVGADTDNFRLEADTPSIPLPPATYERLVDVQTSVSIAPYLSTVGQDVTLTIKVLNRHGLPLQQIPTGIYGDGLEPETIGGMPTSFGGYSHPFSLNVDGSFSVVGQFVRSGNHQPFVSLDHGPTVYASPGAFVQPGPPVSLTFPSTDNFGLGLGFFNMSDQFGNWTPYEVFRVDLTSSAGTQTFYGYTTPSIGSWLIMTPSSWAFRGLTANATITSLSSGASVSGIVNVNPLQPFTTGLAVLGPEPFAQAGDTVTLPPIRATFTFSIGFDMPVEIHQSSRFTSWEANPQIQGTPTVTDLFGTPIPFTVNGNVITIHGSGFGTHGFNLSGVTVSTHAFPDAGMTGTIYIKSLDFFNSPTLAHLGSTGLRMVQMTNVTAFEERASTTEQAHVIAMSDGSVPLPNGSGANAAGEPLFVAMAAGDPQVLGSRFVASLASFRAEGGPVEGGDIPSQAQVELLRVSDVWYVSRPMRALSAGQPLPAGGLTGSDPSDYQTVAAEPGGSLSLSAPGLGNSTSRVAGLDGTVLVTLGAGEDPVPGESGPRPLDSSIFRDRTPTIRLTPSIQGFSVSQTSLGSFLLTSQDNALQAVLNVTSVVDETTSRTFVRQASGNDLLLEVGGASNLTPLSPGVLTLRMSGNLQFKSGPTGTVLDTVSFTQRIRALDYTTDSLDAATGLVKHGNIIPTKFDSGDSSVVLSDPDTGEHLTVWKRRLDLLLGSGQPTDAAVSSVLKDNRLVPMGLDRTLGKVSARSIRNIDLLAARTAPPGASVFSEAALVGPIEFVQPRQDPDTVSVEGFVPVLDASGHAVLDGSRTALESDPSPLVKLDDVTPADVFVSMDGYVHVTLRGTVQDALADILEAGAGDIQELNIFADEELVQTVHLEKDVSFQSPAAQKLIRPFPFKARFEQTVLFQASNGTHHIKVMSSENKAENRGEDDVFIGVDFTGPNPVLTQISNKENTSPGAFRPVLVRINADSSFLSQRVTLEGVAETLPVKDESGTLFATYPHSPPKVFYFSRKGQTVNQLQAGKKSTISNKDSGAIFMIIVDPALGAVGVNDFRASVIVEGLPALQAGDNFTIKIDGGDVPGSFVSANQMKTAAFQVPNKIGPHDVEIDLQSLKIKQKIKDAFEIAAQRDLTIYLTFDDGPVPAAGGSTETILDLLLSRGIQATFFVQTHVVDPPRGADPRGQQLMARAFAEGHSVQIHTGSTLDHVSHNDRVLAPPYDANGDGIINAADGANGLEGDLIRARARIISVTGQPSVNLVRPVGGVHNAAVDRSYQNLKLSMRLWDFDSRDALGFGVDDILSALGDLKYQGAAPEKRTGWSPALRAKQGKQDYSILLFHDISQVTAANLGAYIDKINDTVKKQGRRPVYAPLFESPTP